MLFAELAPLRGEVVERGLLEILRRRLHEFGLRGLPVRPTRDDEIGPRQVGFESGGRGIECGRPGMASSGSVRAGSGPAVAASNVARVTPSCWAAGQSCSSQRVNAASAAC